VGRVARRRTLRTGAGIVRVRTSATTTTTTNA
jgi:hypothetical protein